MAYEFSVALRASCALVTRMTLAHGVYRRVENSLTALMVRSTGADSVVFRGGLPGLGRNRDVAIGHFIARAGRWGRPASCGSFDVLERKDG